MPTPSVTELGRMQLQTLSFFLVGMLVSALAIMGLWNWLRRDFSRLPRLSYFRALGVVVAWGLLFVVVLTMIAGARELLTPSAWQREGSLYRVKDEPTPFQPVVWEGARRQRLGDLRAMLQSYALEHDGRFPPSPEASEIPARAWRIPETPGLRYGYVGGRSAHDEPASILVFEVDAFDDGRWVVKTDGSIGQMSNEEIRREVDKLDREVQP